MNEKELKFIDESNEVEFFNSLLTDDGKELFNSSHGINTILGASLLLDGKY